MGKRDTCCDCRFFYELVTGSGPDPIEAMCSGCEPNTTQCLCCWDTKDAQTFPNRPACRRFEPLCKQFQNESGASAGNHE